MTEEDLDVVRALGQTYLGSGISVVLKGDDIILSNSIWWLVLPPVALKNLLEYLTIIFEYKPESGGSSDHDS